MIARELSKQKNKAA
ncbi:hypothetical protein [Escherichia coli]|nr:hypothetical protein [Escherichia coli]